MRSKYNDNERRLWVLNDEGLYADWKYSRLSLIKFIRENRQVIDEYINRQLNR